MGHRWYSPPGGSVGPPPRRGRSLQPKGLGIPSRLDSVPLQQPSPSGSLVATGGSGGLLPFAFMCPPRRLPLARARGALRSPKPVTPAVDCSRDVAPQRRRCSLGQTCRQAHVSIHRMRHHDTFLRNRINSACLFVSSQSSTSAEASSHSGAQGFGLLIPSFETSSTRVTLLKSILRGRFLPRCRGAILLLSSHEWSPRHRSQLSPREMGNGRRSRSTRASPGVVRYYHTKVILRCGR